MKGDVLAFPVVASCSADATVRIWELCSGSQLAVLRGHTADVHRMQAGRCLVVSGSYDSTARVWDLPPVLDAEALSNARGCFGSGYADAAAAAEPPPAQAAARVRCNHASAAAAAGAPGTASAPGAASASSLHTEARCVFGGHPGGVSEMCLCGNDASLLVTGGAEGEVFLWDVHTGVQLRQFGSRGELWHTAALVTALAVHEGLIVAALMAKEYTRGMLLVWEVATGMRLLCLSQAAHINEIRCEHSVAFCAYSDGYLRAFSLRRRPSAQQHALAFSARSGLSAGVPSSSRPAAGAASGAGATSPPPLGPGVAGDDGRPRVTGGSPQQPTGWGALVQEVHAHEGAISGLDVQGEWAITCGVDHSVRLWHISGAALSSSPPVEMPLPWAVEEHAPSRAQSAQQRRGGAAAPAAKEANAAPRVWRPTNC